MSDGPLIWDDLFADDEEKTVSSSVIISSVDGAVVDGSQNTNPALIVGTAKQGPVVNKRKREGIALCKVYDPAKPPQWKSVIMESKFDGYRCIARIKDGKAQLLTSTGLPHHNIEHVIVQLESSAKEWPLTCDNIVLDGELVHDTLPFDVAGGILRKFDADPRALGFVYHAWDCLPVAEFDAKTCSMTLFYRKEHLEMAVSRIRTIFEVVNADFPPMNYVKAVVYTIGLMSDVEDKAREFYCAGEEGIVIKDPDGLYNYKGKSGQCWLKWKPAFDVGDDKQMLEGDFRITGMKPGKGKHLGRVGAIYIVGFLLDDGNICPDPIPAMFNRSITGRAGTGFSDAEREQFQKWFEEGTLGGRCVEIKYQALSPENSLRFPVFARLRPDKDE